MEPATQNHRAILDRARRDLLDLSHRNRLLALPVRSRLARLVSIVDERSSAVFRLLVEDRKPLSFLPGRPSSPPPAGAPIPPAPPSVQATGFAEDSDEETALPPVDDGVDPATGQFRRHSDSRLQTNLPPEVLQRRLLDLSRDATTTLEETGVNVLYLALGQLKWFEAAAPSPALFAPLVLVPVRLERSNASERFQLRARDEDVEENLSLRTKLEMDLGVSLPPFPDPDSFDLNAYLAAVSSAIAAQPEWQVQSDAIVLGCFSFAKLLLYRDLAPESWPLERPLLAHPFIPALLAEGFPPGPPPIPDSTHLDDLVSVDRLDHVVDADASQALAIEMVRQGRNLVLQGPPGTGKSQSITNIIATAVLDGKRVLFVAEKLAALEVVQRRLQREGLGDICLELHSNKASKRAVLEEIARTWRLGKPRDADFDSALQQLESRRAALNAHCRRLHAPHAPTGLTPYQVLGELIRLGDSATAAANIDLADAETWSPSDRAAREELLAEIGNRIAAAGTPANNIWRGVRRETILPPDLPVLTQRITEVLALMDACRTDAQALADALNLPYPHNLATTRRLCACARQILAAPSLDPLAIIADVWHSSRQDLRDLIATGLRFQKAQKKFANAVTDSAWERDFEPVREALATHGRSLFRIFNSAYRHAVGELRAVAKTEIPKDFRPRIGFVDELVEGQKALRALRAADTLGASAFGKVWRQERSDWPLLERILHWVEGHQADGLDGEFRKTFAAITDTARIEPLNSALGRHLGQFIPPVHTLFADLDLDLAVAFGTADLEAVPFAALQDRLGEWRHDPRSLSIWTQYTACVRRARELGLDRLVDALHSGVIPAAEARAAFQRACFTRVFREFTRLHPDLAHFDGASHSRLIEEFRKLDRERLNVARHRVLAHHHSHMPAMNAGVGAVGIVTGEMERKRGHRPVRQLLRDAGSVIQAVKPVFMMSPLSVARHLAPGVVEFDLLVIDEASQVQPIDALGAIARCRQIVVVGDSRQLPPTRFFARVTGEEDDSHRDQGAAGMEDIESILGLCSARGLPATMLRWHYRSRHHSLIAVSNREFYENRLFIVPSPRPARDDLGLHLHPVNDGVFDSGGTGTNRVEAKAVCRAVMDHARRHPDLSLGVAAFSVRQQQAILDELELLRREHPETESFFSAHPAEPFFVKNLENVQGDERDIVFISIGYGRDPDGLLRMNFGPLGAEGGERRLNVLISRARRRCVVFSSIRAADIDPDRATGRGVHALKAFLQFAETGQLDPGGHARRESRSPFDSTVQAALSQLDYSIHSQVGVAGFFIDLAVTDPSEPGRYILGIECDGETYEASRSARDRDRLRQAVLEDHGWNLHRIWSADWFQRPEEQLSRTIAAIERARRLSPSDPRPPVPGAPANPIGRDEADDAPSTTSTLPAEPYVLTEFTPPHGSEPQSLQPAQLTEVLLRIIEVEGPIHEDEVVVRIRDLWKLQRAGARLQEAVARGIRSLLIARRCVREDGCLDLPGRVARVRSREGLSSANLRRHDILPPSEIRAAILRLVDAAHGVARRELPTAVARFLGFKITSAALRALVESQIARLELEGGLTEKGALLQRPG